MTVEDFRELCAYIEAHHSFKKGQGKMVKYISPTYDVRIGEIFHVNIRLSGMGRDFSITNENINKDLKSWIIDWLDNGKWLD